jgi:hypothetical protein
MLPDDASADLLQQRAARARQLVQHLDVARFPRARRRSCRLRPVRPES